MVLVILVHGNSLTTDKLKTARTIEITGAISGKTSFDGSKDIEIQVKQSNIIVITGTISLSEGKGSTTVSYPTGYTKDNSVIISATVEITTNVPTSEKIWTRLASNHINITSAYDTGPTASRNYKLVLMKIT